MFMPFNNTNQLNELNKKVDELIRENNELKNRIGAIEKNNKELNEKIHKLESSKVPVYRLVHNSTGEHFYTISEEEKNSAQSKYGYRLEFVGFNALK